MQQATNKLLVYSYRLILLSVGQDSSVGIATCYGLGGPGIESRCGRGFPHPSRTALGAFLAYYTVGTGFFFLGVKRPGGDLDHTHTSSAEIKERAELYIYSFSCLCLPVLG